MEFRTVIKPEHGKQGQIRHGQPILLIGSCFADNIGQKLKRGLFDACINPFGPLYNPCSILNSLRKAVRNEKIEARELFENYGLNHSFDFHSRFSDSDKDTALALMNQSIHEANACLRNASTVIITLATTWIFKDKFSGKTVANCHKLPAKNFEQHSLSLDECEESLRDIINIISEVNAKARVIFTVSPLRYLGLGAHGNQLAKSTLLLAIDRVCKHQFELKAEYFPAYEVMMDDLRDYRFYAQDMKHPSSQAVDYIFELFAATYFDEETNKIQAEAVKLTQRLEHILLNKNEDMIAAELREREEMVKTLLSRYPQLDKALINFRK